MKKILFATTALVASAGFAAAEVKISGNAEMGIAKYGEDNVATTQVDEGAAIFVSTVDIDFALRGESDNGISFGADIDLDEAGSANQRNKKEAVYVQAGGLKVTMGDTDGAFDARLAEPFLAGSSINDDETTHIAAMHADNVDGSHDGQVLRVDYTFSGVTVSVSAEQNTLAQTGTYTGPAGSAGAATDPAYGIGVSYDANLGGVDMNFALAYQQSTFTNAAITTATEMEIWGATVAAFFGNGFSAAIGYADMSANNALTGAADPTASGSMWSLGLGYEQGPIAVGINYGEIDYDAAGTDVSGWGMAASYDFGGGLSANFGYGSSDLAAPGADYDTYSLGLRMKF